jgi:hypothetical protein
MMFIARSCSAAADNTNPISAHPNIALPRMLIVLAQDREKTRRDDPYQAYIQPFSRPMLKHVYALVTRRDYGTGAGSNNTGLYVRKLLPTMQHEPAFSLFVNPLDRNGALQSPPPLEDAKTEEEESVDEDEPRGSRRLKPSVV